MDMNGDILNVTIVLPSLNPDDKLNKVVDGLLGAGYYARGNACDR